MMNYQIRIPEDYEEMREIGRTVSQTILERKIPAPDHIAKVLGKETKGAYYLMHALFHSIEYGRNRGILDYARRDRKAIQRHSFDAAFKPFYRFDDQRLPSNYLLTERENKGIMVHDLGEEFGKSILGALVVNDVIRYLLREEAGSDADLLTNYNDLLLDSLWDKIIELRRIDHDNLQRVVGEGRAQIKVEDKDIEMQYSRITNALRNFDAHINENVVYMPKPARKDLAEIINELHIGVIRQIKNLELLTPHEATNLITGIYDNVIGIIKNKHYIEVDESLLLPGDPEFLLTVKQTLYDDFIKRITGEVRNNATRLQNEEYKDDSYLSPIMEKLAESTDTVANMDHSALTNATSIHRKARTLLASTIELADHLAGQNIDYQRLQMSTGYLFRNLDVTIYQHLQTLKERAVYDTNWEPDLKIFQLMAEKMTDLESRVSTVKGKKFL